MKDTHSEELITLVNMALGNQPQLSACPHGIPADITDIVQVDIALIIRAVSNALNGCPAVPTPTPTLPCLTLGGIACGVPPTP